jgi:hypothetical protein
MALSMKDRWFIGRMVYVLCSVLIKLHAGLMLTHFEVHEEINKEVKDLFYDKQ